MGFTPELILELQSKGFETVSMGHAFRLNGVVDLWYNGRTVYDITKNEYMNFKQKEEAFTKAINIASNNEKKDSFKKTVARNRMSYQEFRHKQMTPTAEYYHWDNNKNTSEDSLYFIQSGVNVKIGRSNDPEKRLTQLSTGIAEQPKILLVVPNKGNMEKILHKAFESWRIRSNSEWFLLSDQIAKFINHISPVKPVKKRGATKRQILSESMCKK